MTPVPRPEPAAPGRAPKARLRCRRCRLLPWDSEFFGVRIAQLEGHRFTPWTLDAVLAWCEGHAIDCLYFLADSNDPASIRIAEDGAFRLVEIRAVYQRRLDDWSVPAQRASGRGLVVRPARTGDLPAFQRIARGAYRHSRFVRDPRFPRERCRLFYPAWIKAACDGRSDFVLAAEREGRVTGYICGSANRETRAGRLDLVGVAKGDQGAGVGRALCEHALDELARRGIETASVDTQGSNVLTQRLLQRLGCLSVATWVYYHRWFPREPER